MKKILSVITFLAVLLISITAYAKSRVAPYAYIIPQICVQCGACIGQCPTGAISEGDPYKVNRWQCVGCGACMNVCPVGAIWMVEFEY